MITHGKQVWIEDDATIHDPGHETLYHAYRRITGQVYSYKDAIESDDQGDGTLRLMPTGYVVWASYPGGGAIYAPAEESR